MTKGLHIFMRTVRCSNWSMLWTVKGFGVFRVQCAHSIWNYRFFSIDWMHEKRHQTINAKVQQTDGPKMVRNFLLFFFVRLSHSHIYLIDDKLWSFNHIVVGYLNFVSISTLDILSACILFVCIVYDLLICSSQQFKYRK